MFPRFANTAVLETSAVFVHPTPQQKVDLGSRSRSSKDIALKTGVQAIVALVAVLAIAQALGSRKNAVRCIISSYSQW